MATFVHIFDQVLDDYRLGRIGTIHEPSSEVARQENALKLLFTCILSSNWIYEKALSASEQLASEMFASIAAGRNIEQESIESFLRRKEIGCRFPASKAKQLRCSILAAQKIDQPLFEHLRQIESERSAREYVINTFPGLGYKQSSMFLRDLGLARELAIIDTHIVWYLYNVENVRVERLGKKNYIMLEDCLRQISHRVGIALSILDRLIWVTVREFKKARSGGKCGMQYVLPLVD